MVLRLSVKRENRIAQRKLDIQMVKLIIILIVFILNIMHNQV